MRLMRAMGQIPVALTIAGSDSSAGAGLQADLKTFGALDVYGVSAVTCVVAETPGVVSKIESVSEEMVRAQIDVLFESFPIKAVKTGLLFSREIVRVVSKALQEVAIGEAVPLVIDPVMVATSGDFLLNNDAVEVYEQELFPKATLITPNLNEATRLFGEPVTNLETMKKAGAKLSLKYGTAVLLKGGHLSGSSAIDLLFIDGQVLEFAAPFLKGVATHGTGCTYSAAITAGL